MENIVHILQGLGWSRGFLIFAVLAVLFAVDGLAGLRFWLSDRRREGRLADPVARALRRVRLLPAD